MKPNYSSFKLGGVQVRGKNAAILQSTFLAFRLFVNMFKFLWHVSAIILWFIFLSLKWYVDFLIGFYKGTEIKEN